MSVFNSKDNPQKEIKRKNQKDLLQINFNHHQKMFNINKNKNIQTSSKQILAQASECQCKNNKQQIKVRKVSKNILSQFKKHPGTAMIKVYVKEQKLKQSFSASQNDHKYQNKQNMVKREKSKSQIQQNSTRRFSLQLNTKQISQKMFVYKESQSQKKFEQKKNKERQKFLQRSSSQIQKEQQKLNKKLSQMQRFYSSLTQNEISKIMQKYEKLKSDEKKHQLNNYQKRSYESCQQQSYQIKRQKIIQLSKSTLFNYFKRPRILQNPQNLCQRQIQQFLTNPFHKSEQILEDLRIKKRELIKKQVNQILKNCHQSLVSKQSIFSKSFSKPTKSLQMKLSSQNIKITQILQQKSKCIIQKVFEKQKQKNTSQFQDLKFVPFHYFLSLQNFLKQKVQNKFHDKRSNKFMQKIKLEQIQKSSIFLKNYNKRKNNLMNLAK